MSTPNDLLRLNVGFIVHQTIGYSRDFPFEAPFLHLHPDLDLKDFQGSTRITRTAQGLLLQVEMSAVAMAECVRCLSEFSQPLRINFTELYAFTRNSITESGLLMPENGKIDLSPLVREEMILAMPINPICRIDCKGLCPVCGENLNETVCSHDQEDIDPRLGVLKAMLKDESDSSTSSGGL
ncbi:MAG: DUF177 domain-containing protein [Chloroflexota bacterium]